MSARHASHLSQPITTKGTGLHFSSPRKARNKKKTSTAVNIPGRSFKHQKLLDELQDLLASPPLEPGPSENHSFQAATHIPEPMEPQDSLQMELEDAFTFDTVTCDSAAVECVRTSRSTSSICASWKVLLPTIIEPFINYTAATLGKPLSVLTSSLSSCIAHCQESKSTTVLCLCFNRKYLKYIVTSLVNYDPHQVLYLLMSSAVAVPRCLKHLYLMDYFPLRPPSRKWQYLWNFSIFIVHSSNVRAMQSTHLLPL